MNVDLSKLITRANKQAAIVLAEKAAMAEALNTFRTDREKFLNRIAGIGFSAQASNDTVTVQHVLNVRQGLLDLTAKPAVTGAATLPALLAAMKAEYEAILVGVPAQIKAAFKGVSQ